MNGDRNEFRGSRARVQHGILLGAVLAVIGLGSLFFGGSSVPDAELVGAVVLVMAAGVLAVVMRSARDQRPRLVLDRDGVWFRDWDIAAVPWAAIDAVYTSGSRLQAFITLSLRDPEGFLSALPQAERARLTSNRLFRRPELRIPHNALDAPLDEVLAALRSGLED
ncbi:MAG: hypothetical protein IH924_01730 [Proteobacteria bacterium]|nr:hypothetical protein [Pseudomonadota bacterium]